MLFRSFLNYLKSKYSDYDFLEYQLSYKQNDPMYEEDYRINKVNNFVLNNVLKNILKNNNKDSILTEENYNKFKTLLNLNNKI